MTLKSKVEKLMYGTKTQTVIVSALIEDFSLGSKLNFLTFYTEKKVLVAHVYKLAHKLSNNMKNLYILPYREFILTTNSMYFKP